MWAKGPCGTRWVPLQCHPTTQPLAAAPDPVWRSILTTTLSAFLATPPAPGRSTPHLFAFKLLKAKRGEREPLKDSGNRKTL